MRYLSALICIVLLSSCGGPKAIVDYDREANFSAYKTYNMFPDINTELSQLDEKRLYDAIDVAMQNKGFTKAENPDIYINVFTSQYEDVNRNTIGVGLGSGGFGVSGGIPIGGGRVNYMRFTMDFIEAKKDDLVWQVKLDERFNLRASPEKRETFFKTIVVKALKQYPPK